MLAHFVLVAVSESLPPTGLIESVAEMFAPTGTPSGSPASEAASLLLLCRWRKSARPGAP